jgi:excinuclease ABC subunit C
MQQAAADLNFEKAAKCRDEIKMLEALNKRGSLKNDDQPEVFFTDPAKGIAGLRKVLGLDFEPRKIEGVDIAHLGGMETVASLVQFIDGLPFKPGYRRFKIKDVKGVDDFRSIYEVVARRFKRLDQNHDLFPDILLIDGGKGQLSSALAAFRDIDVDPPLVLSLAKKDELIYRPGEPEPLSLSRNSHALKLLQYIRDESHRFAQHYHHILRSKKVLDDS